MPEWQRLLLPHICERLIAFSVPQKDEFLIVSYDGMHLVHLTDTPTVETDDSLAEYAAFEPESGMAQFRGREYQMVGVHGGKPKLDSDAGERLVLDPKGLILSVCRGASVVFALPYTNFSGDWASATFSKDDRFIVLGCPYDFDLIVLKRQGTADRALGGEGGQHER